MLHRTREIDHAVVVVAVPKIISAVFIATGAPG
jgi:hypothetical protein